MKHLIIKFSFTISHDLFKLKIISRNTFIQYSFIEHLLYANTVKKTMGTEKNPKQNHIST